MKVAIFGVSGQLGRDLTSAFSAHHVDGIDHARADVRRNADVERVVRDVAPDWVINCAAMTHVDACETDPLAAFEANALGARHVARAAALAGARLVHISTDYVFDGAKRGAYVEADPPLPINAYGITKLAGEHFSRYEHRDAVIVRTSGLYGLNPCRGKGSSFAETMLARANGATPLRVVSDERLTPTFTPDLASQIVAMIDRGVAGGVYHATNAGECSWHEFAVELLKQAGSRAAVEPMRAAEWKSPTRRPANSVLENRALRELGLDRMPDWRDALARYTAARRAAKPS